MNLSPTRSEEASISHERVHDALVALGINPIGLFGVAISRIEGTVRVEYLVRDDEGRYVVEGAEYVTETVELEIV